MEIGCWKKPFYLLISIFQIGSYWLRRTIVSLKKLNNSTAIYNLVDIIIKIDWVFVITAFAGGTLYNLWHRELQ